MKIIPSKNSTVNLVDINVSKTDLECNLEKSINVQQLCQTAGMQIMLITLDSKAELKKHSASGPISVQVIKGSISFRTDDSTHDLKSGQLLVLEGNLPHSVYANERSIFLVTKSISQ